MGVNVEVKVNIKVEVEVDVDVAIEVDVDVDVYIDEDVDVGILFAVAEHLCIYCAEMVVNRNCARTGKAVIIKNTTKNTSKQTKTIQSPCNSRVHGFGHAHGAYNLGHRRSTPQNNHHTKQNPHPWIWPRARRIASATVAGQQSEEAHAQCV